MQFSSKRGQGATVPVIIGLVLGLVFLFVVFSIYGVVQSEALNVNTVSQTSCWLTNTLNCGEGVFSFFPTLCQLDVQEEPVDSKQVRAMLRDTWWMYKQGGCDFTTQLDEIYPTFAFVPAEDIKINELMRDLQSNNRGRETDVIHSDYNYLEEGTKLNTLCFDTNDKEGIENGILAKGEQYFIIYYDNVDLIEIEAFKVKSDAILISNDPNFDKGAYFNLLVESGSVLVGTQASFVLTPIALIASYGTADWYLSRVSEEERGCLVYGPSSK